MAERGRAKLAQARPTDAAPRPAVTLEQALRSDGSEVRVVACFPNCGWDELIDEAIVGVVQFGSGALTFSPTPAMTLIDVDGTAPPATLALAAVEPLAAALRRFDLAGSIGIDFPTLELKAQRQAVDEALARELGDWPHARTAMNGFGFVQVVSKLARVSLLHRAAFSRAGLSARRLMRRAERLAGAGAIELAGHPALSGQLRPEWLEELGRRMGREVRWRADPALALEAPHAQLVPR
jgi:Ribonuclease G/E